MNGAVEVCWRYFLFPFEFCTVKIATGSSHIDHHVLASPYFSIFLLVFHHVDFDADSKKTELDFR